MLIWCKFHANGRSEIKIDPCFNVIPEQVHWSYIFIHSTISELHSQSYCYSLLICSYIFLSLLTYMIAANVYKSNTQVFFLFYYNYKCSSDLKIFLLVEQINEKQLELTNSCSYYIQTANDTPWYTRMNTKEFNLRILRNKINLINKESKIFSTMSLLKKGVILMYYLQKMSFIYVSHIRSKIMGEYLDDW